MTRICSECGSGELAMVAVGNGYSRKECVACGSTGPFLAAPVDCPGGRGMDDLCTWPDVEACGLCTAGNTSSNPVPSTGRRA